MNGYELARQLRQVAATRQAHLIALTGWGQENDRHQAREAGFDNHLVKPTKADALLALVEGEHGRRAAPIVLGA